MTKKRLAIAGKTKSKLNIFVKNTVCVYGEKTNNAFVIIFSSQTSLDASRKKCDSDSDVDGENAGDDCFDDLKEFDFDNYDNEAGFCFVY